MISLINMFFTKCYTNLPSKVFSIYPLFMDENQLDLQPCYPHFKNFIIIYPLSATVLCTWVHGKYGFFAI
jgi:hypothetical protein